VSRVSSPESRVPGDDRHAGRSARDHSNSLKAWQRDALVPVRQPLPCIYPQAHSNRKISVHSLSLFVRHAAVAHPFSTAAHTHASSARGSRDERGHGPYFLSIPKKPNERVANLALRAKIAIEKYDQGYVSFEEVGQMVADVVVQDVQVAAKQSSGEITETWSRTWSNKTWMGGKSWMGPRRTRSSSWLHHNIRTLIRTCNRLKKSVDHISFMNFGVFVFQSRNLHEQRSTNGNHLKAVRRLIAL
jgi:hypothetical protein